jgi:hypothetical protein
MLPRADFHPLRVLRQADPNNKVAYKQARVRRSKRKPKKPPSNATV